MTENIAAARGQRGGADDVRGLGHRLRCAPGAPQAERALVVGIRLDERLENVELVLDPAIGERHGGLIENRIREGAEAAQIHGAESGEGAVYERRHELIALADEEGGIRRHGVAEIGLRRAPHATVAEVHIPGQRLPLAVPLAVAIDVVVLVAAVVVAGHDLSGDVVQRFRHAGVVVKKALFRHASGTEAGHEGREVGVALPFARLLLSGGRTAGKERVVHLIERALVVEARRALEEVGVAVFDHVRGAVVGVVPADLDGVRPVSGHAGLAQRGVAEDVPQICFVGISGEEVEAVDPRRAVQRRRVPFQFEAGVEVEVVALFGKALTALAVEVGAYVVEELPVVEDGAAPAARAVVGGGVVGEPVEHRQLSARDRIRHGDDSAPVFR